MVSKHNIDITKLSIRVIRRSRVLEFEQKAHRLDPEKQKVSVSMTAR